jgi:hypothetical protein
LSVGNRSGSPRAGGKSAASKKVKKAKSDFQGPKRHYAPESTVDMEEARKRVLDSLEHLGHQQFSKEPGGYDLRSWLKGLRTLLDDFEEKVGAGAVTEELRAKRAEVEAAFSRQADTAQVDSEIDAARTEEVDIRRKLKDEEERIASRLSAIGGEKTGKSQELEEERVKLEKVKEERKSASFFSKLVGKSGPSMEPSQRRVSELETGLSLLEEETVNLQLLRRSVEGGRSASGGAFDELWKRLTALEIKLRELGLAREDRVQLLHEREEATGALRKIISELKLEEEKEAEA